MDMSLSKLQELVMDREAACSSPLGLKELDTIEWLNWTDDEKNIFFGNSSRRPCRSSENHPTSASSALVVRAQTWITLILNGFPWKWTEIIFLFWFCTQEVYFRLLLTSTLVWSIKVIYGHQNSDVHEAFWDEPIQTPMIQALDHLKESVNFEINFLASRITLVALSLLFQNSLLFYIWTIQFSFSYPGDFLNSLSFKPIIVIKLRRDFFPGLSLTLEYDMQVCKLVLAVDLHTWAQYMHTESGPLQPMESESEVAQSCPSLCTPWAAAHQAPLSMGFSRQEYWGGLPFPPPEDLPDPGI